MKKSLKQAVLVGSLLAAAYACQPKVSQPSSTGGDAGSGAEQTPAMPSGQDMDQDMNSMMPTNDNSAPAQSMDQSAPAESMDQSAPSMDDSGATDQAVPETTKAPVVESPAAPASVAQPSIEKPVETAPAAVISEKAEPSQPSSVSASSTETAPSPVSKAAESESAPSISTQSLEAAK